MRILRAVKLLKFSSLVSQTSFYSSSSTTTTLIRTTTTTTKYRNVHSLTLFRVFSAEPESHDHPNSSDDTDSNAVFDSSHYTLPFATASATTASSDGTARVATWNKAYRAKVDKKIFGSEPVKQKQKHKQSQKQKKSKNPKQVVEQVEEEEEEQLKLKEEEEEEEKKKRATRLLTKAILQVALENSDEYEEEQQLKKLLVKEEDQRSLSVGVIGAPNAGKSSLTNYMVGTKVAAVSRKTNTTIHEVLGVLTKGNTQICFFDTPGLALKHRWFPSKDIQARVESNWSSMDLYDLLIVIFDVHRHLTTPDSRVIKLINHLGTHVNPKQKRVLCMNKVDLVEKKKDLLKVAKEFGDLPAYERYFMISGLKGSGVKDLVQYLMEQAVKRPWDEEPTNMTEENMKNISLEVVREKMLDQIHQEIPYVIEHRLMDWKELRDGSLRVEQHFIAKKKSQRRILVGKNGSKIGRIGMEANEELRSIFKRNVHLILHVKDGLKP